MKILIISPNNKKSNINNILSSNTDSLIIDSSIYNNFIESFNDELDDILNENILIKYIDMIDPNNEINEKMKNEIKNINKEINISNENRLYGNNTIYINKDYNYVMYYNNVMYDLISNNILNENEINDKYINLLSIYLKYDYNTKNDIILGDVYILKYDNNHNLMEINEKELREIIYKNIFFTYYSGYCNNIVLGNKLRYKSIIHNETDKNEKYEILYDKKLVKFIKDNVMTIFKYNILFNDYLDDNNNYIEFCDKYNLLISNNIEYGFSWCDIEKKDIENII